ncbi:MAG: hypothetical protein QXV83_03920 [Candidatus Anstonellaceae archaeon]
MFQNLHILLKFSLFFLLFGGILYSQDWGEWLQKSNTTSAKDFKLFNVNWYKQSNYSDEFYWIKFSAIVVAICFFANVIIYMLAKAFDAENVKRFAISEFYQTTATAFGIVAFVYLLNTGFIFIQDLFLPSSAVFSCQDQKIKLWDQQAGPFTLIKCKISEYLEASNVLYLSAYLANMVKETEGSKCKSYVGWQSCKIWEEGVYREIESYHYIANRLASLSISLVAQYFFVTYLEQNLLSFFLPVGLLLRLFPPLRGIGSLFIAVAIGFYFIFPIAYIFIQPSLIKVVQTPQPPTKNDVINNICFAKFGPFAQFSSFESNENDSSIIFSSDIEEFIVQVSMGTFFYPFLSLAITVIFINFLANFLSADSTYLLHFISKNL